MFPKLTDILGQEIKVGDIVTFGASGEGWMRISKVTKVETVPGTRWNYETRVRENIQVYQVTVQSVTRDYDYTTRVSKTVWGRPARPRIEALVKLGDWTVERVESHYGIESMTDEGEVVDV